MLRFRRRLAVRVLAPIIGFTLLLGIAVIAFAIYATSRFSNEQAATNLRLRTYTARQIADDHLGRDQPLSDHSDSAAGRDRRIKAQLAMEDFARTNEVQIIVFDEARQRQSELGDLAIKIPEAFWTSRDERQDFESDGQRYQAQILAFEPWHWRIAVIQNRRTYDLVQRELLHGAGLAAAVLAAALLFFLAYLVAIMRRPIDAIIADLKAGKRPDYAGIAEFEFLSTSIAKMMSSEQEKTAVIEGYRDHLAQLVGERTAELAQTNEELQKANRDLAETHLQLLQAEKLASIGQLAAGVAHEINNPIGFVKSNLFTLDTYVRDLLRLLETYQQAEPALAGMPALRQAISDLKREIDFDYLRQDLGSLIAESKDGLERVKLIVQDLKDFSRAGGDDEWQATDLNRCLDSTLNIAASEIKRKADVVKAYGELPLVECLPSQLNQVFLNLMVNAAHAIDGHGTITLSSGRSEGWVWIAIADTGSGISPETMKHIFDPFFTTKPVGQGTGLGLSVSYSIVSRHSGRIEVDSELGRGSTFRVWLPIARAPQAEASPANAG